MAAEGYRLGTAHTATAAVKEVAIDLDVDSNNDSVIDPANLPGGIDDGIEDFAALPGYLLQTYDDVDEDGVKDFADGFDAVTGAGETADDVISQWQPFGQVKLSITDGIDPTKAKVRFTYNATDPAAVSRTGSWAAGQAQKYSRSDSGDVRLWTKAANEKRYSTTLPNDGNFLPKDTWFDASLLFGQTGRQKNLYIEAVGANAAAGGGWITVELDATGDGTAIVSDVVKFSSWKRERPVLTGTAGAGGTSANLNWTHPFSEKGYRVMQLTGTGWKTLAEVDQNARSFVVNGLTADKAYSFRVVAKNSNPSLSANVVDPSLPSRLFTFVTDTNKLTAFNLLIATETSHKQAVYYEAGSEHGQHATFAGQPGIRGLFDRLFLTLNIVGVDINAGWTTNNDPSAKYYPNSNLIEIRAVGAYEYDVVHELVHAIDDAYEWHAPFVQRQEALAYAAADHVLSRVGGSGLSVLSQQSVGTTSFSNLQITWNAGWKTMNNLAATTVSYGIFYSRPLATKDIADAKTRLGASLSASELLSLYNKWLTSNGFPSGLLHNNFTGFTNDPTFQ